MLRVSGGCVKGSFVYAFPKAVIFFFFKEPVKYKILCFNNSSHVFFFFLLQMENYFLICWEIYMLTVPGKTSSLSLNSLLIT